MKPRRERGRGRERHSKMLTSCFNVVTRGQVAVTGLRSLEAAFHGSILGAERERNPWFRPSSRNIQIIIVFLSVSISLHRSRFMLLTTRIYVYAQVRYIKYIPSETPLLNSTAVYVGRFVTFTYRTCVCCVNLRTSFLLM